MARPHDRRRGVPAVPRRHGCRDGVLAASACQCSHAAPARGAVARTDRDRRGGVRLVGRGWRTRLAADPGGAAADRGRRPHRGCRSRRAAAMVGDRRSRRPPSRRLRMDVDLADRRRLPGGGRPRVHCARLDRRGDVRLRAPVPRRRCRATTPRACRRPPVPWPRCSSGGSRATFCGAVGCPSSPGSARCASARGWSGLTRSRSTSGSGRPRSCS